MKIGISLHFGFKGLGAKKSLECIKGGGFDCIITNSDTRFKKDNGTIPTQMRLAKKYGLLLSSLHMRYKSKELFNFWLDNKIGDRLERRLIKDLKLAHKYSFTCVVVHLDGEFNNIGVERLKRVLKVARKVNIPLALENIHTQKPLLETLEYFKDEEYIKMCYDSGHNHAFDPELDYLEKYKDKIITLHLHDNDGSADQHTLNRFGTINWKELARKIAKTNVEILDYELLLYKKPTPMMSKEEILKECYNQGVELSKMIEEERKKLKSTI